MITGHRGNIYRLAETIGCPVEEIIDMSSNINPVGPIPGLIPLLKKKLISIKALPEADAASIIKATADRYGISPARIGAGNGTTQFIYALPHMLNIKNALIIGPTYADYADACRAYHVKFEYFFAHENKSFIPDVSRIRRLAPRFDAVFICNPNNPTGACLSRNDIEAISGACSKTFLVIDESYFPFINGWEDESLMTTGLPNVIVLHSLSKIYALPGLRIGFIIFPEALRKQFVRFFQPWSVNSTAQIAAGYLMDNREKTERFIKRSRKFIESEKKSFLKNFKEMPGIFFFPSKTGYLLARTPGLHSGKRLWEHLASRKILIRNCENFNGLSDQYVRISIKDQKSNRTCAGEIRNFLGKPNRSGRRRHREMPGQFSMRSIE